MSEEGHFVEQKPWIGANYGTARVGNKLLIVGESHHHPKDCRKPGCDWCKARKERLLTRHSIKKLAIPEIYQFHRKVRELFGQQSENPDAFWQSVAFYNYLQITFDRPKVRVPTAERMDPRNMEAFCLVLEELQPERVILLGKSNWQYVVSDKSKGFEKRLRSEPTSLPLDPRMGHLSGGEKECYVYTFNKWLNRALVGGIKHPSSPGFAVETWKRWALNFMELEF